MTLTRTEARVIESLFAEMAEASAAATLPLFRRSIDVDNKRASGFDPVTEADKACERALRRIISRTQPQAGILGEEYGLVNGDARDVWVIDPIDGTRAFIAGLPVWGVLAGLKRDGRTVAGMMHQPFTGETFIGMHVEDGPQARFERAGETAPLRTRTGVRLDEAYAMTTAPELVTDPVRRIEAGVRHMRYGGDCYAFAMLALGQVDLVVEADVEPYDVTALIPIVEAAGGVITTFDGGRAEAGGDVVAAGSPELHARALEVLAG